MAKKIGIRAGLFSIMLSICMIAAKPASAKNKTGYYCFMTTSQDVYNKYGNDYQAGMAYYARIKKNKLILKGTLQSYSSQGAMYNGQSYRILSEKKRVFKITKYTKYYATEGESIGKMYESCQISKKMFNRYLKELYGMGVYVKIKNGKVIYLEMRN